MRESNVDAEASITSRSPAPAIQSSRGRPRHLTAIIVRSLSNRWAGPMRCPARSPGPGPTRAEQAKEGARESGQKSIELAPGPRRSGRPLPDLRRPGRPGPARAREEVGTSFPAGSARPVITRERRSPFLPMSSPCPVLPGW